MRYVVDPMPVLCGETMSPTHVPENRPHFRSFARQIKVHGIVCARSDAQRRGLCLPPLTGSPAYWIVSTALVDVPKSPRVRNDRLKPIFCDTSLVTVSRVCENVIT